VRRLGGSTESPCSAIAFNKATTWVNYRPVKCVAEYTPGIIQGLVAYLQDETRLTRPISIPAFLNRRRLTILIKIMIKQLRNPSFPWGQNFGLLNARPGRQGWGAEAQTLLHSGSTCDWLNRRRIPMRSWRSHEDNIYLNGDRNTHCWLLSHLCIRRSRWLVTP
jgi:hypothetical protein